MIGVILWSDQRTGRAVIWCEDNNGLAYLTGREARRFRNSFDVGDILSFHIEEKQKARWVFNAVKLDQSWGRTLIDALSDDAGLADVQAVGRPSPNVVGKENRPLDIGQELQQFLRVKTGRQTASG
mgnify:CR=1 FL=1